MISLILDQSSLGLLSVFSWSYIGMETMWTSLCSKATLCWSRCFLGWARERCVMALLKRVPRAQRLPHHLICTCVASMGIFLWKSAECWVDLGVGGSGVFLTWKDSGV